MNYISFIPWLSFFFFFRWFFYQRKNTNVLDKLRGFHFFTSGVLLNLAKFALHCMITWCSLIKTISIFYMSYWSTLLFYLFTINHLPITISTRAYSNLNLRLLHYSGILWLPLFFKTYDCLILITNLKVNAIESKIYKYLRN